MIDWIKENKTGMILVAILGALGVGLLAASGCSLGDMVKVNVPPGIQRSLAAPSQVSLNDSEYTWNQWVEFVEGNTTRFQDSIDRSNFVWSSLASAVNLGAESAQGPLSALPGGTFLLTGLSLTAGLFLNKPGTANKIAKEKEKSFNAGMKAGNHVSAET